MKFYYEIEYKNGSHIGGHNCEEVKMDEQFLRLKGHDVALDCEGDWVHVDRIEDIKSFKLEVMKEEE